MFFKKETSENTDPNSREYKVSQMFKDMDRMLLSLNKKRYEERFAKFEGDFGDLINEFVIDENPKAQASLFVDCVLKNFIGWTGKLNKVKVQGAAIYMIYYVFPEILIKEEMNAISSSDTPEDESPKPEDKFSECLAKEWRIRSDNPKFNFTTYTEIHDAFVTKFLGIPIKDKD